MKAREMPRRVATVTVNPALDRFEVLPQAEVKTFVGGKGLNVASWLAAAGLTVTVTGFVGEVTAAPFEQEFAARGYVDRFLRCPGATRENLKRVHLGLGLTEERNGAGLLVGEETREALLGQVEELGESHAWIVISGSLPAGMPPGYAAQLIVAAKRGGAKVAFDSSGEALRQGVLVRPELLKPNRGELETLAGGPRRRIAEVEEVAAGLVSDGVEVVLASLEGKGAVAASVGGSFVATPPPALEVVSAVGAGDALLAGYLVAELAGGSLEGRLRLAMAYAAVAVGHLGSACPGLAEAAVRGYADTVGLSPLLRRCT